MDYWFCVLDKDISTVVEEAQWITKVLCHPNFEYTLRPKFATKVSPLEGTEVLSVYDNLLKRIILKSFTPSYISVLTNLLCLQKEQEQKNVFIRGNRGFVGDSNSFAVFNNRKFLVNQNAFSKTLIKYFLMQPWLSRRPLDRKPSEILW